MQYSIYFLISQHQRLNRDSAMWQDTLRLRQPHLDGMRGLRRISLNNNPKLGDSGVVVIAEDLVEDLWIKGKLVYPVLCPFTDCSL